MRRKLETRTQRRKKTQFRLIMAFYASLAVLTVAAVRDGQKSKALESKAAVESSMKRTSSFESCLVAKTNLAVKPDVLVSEDYNTLQLDLADAQDTESAKNTLKDDVLPLAAVFISNDTSINEQSDTYIAVENLVIEQPEDKPVVKMTKEITTTEKKTTTTTATEKKTTTTTATKKATTEKKVATKYSGIKHSSVDIKVLQNIVEAECTDGDYESKYNVACVILNRVLSDEFPNTIPNVVFQRGQFSPISDGRYGSLPISETTKKVCSDVFSGKDTTSNSLYFAAMRYVKNSKIVGWFSTLQKVKTDKIGHTFFK